MKKTTLLFVALLMAGSMMASPVEQSTAHRLAVKFWNTYRPQTVMPVTSLKMLSFDDLQHMYVFVGDEEGFIIVSSDDCVRPVLGYSFDSPFPTQIHPELHYWLMNYEQQIAFAIRQGVASDPRWAAQLSAEVPSTPVTLQNVPALCSTKWDQGDPYNRMCPYDSVRSDRAVVGCVATAMAQIMKRWEHPSCGTGSHSYMHYAMDGVTSYGMQSADFANTTYMWQDMPNYVVISTTDKKARALSTLSYHCGVAVDMMYGTHSMGGSGAFSSYAANAFYEYFKYAPSLQYRYRDFYSDSVWLAMIDEDLANGRPIYYDGSDNSGGHAFVLDGSNIDTTYHFNWGWNGYGNGFYAMDNLAPGSGGIGGNATYTFNSDQGAIFGIQPLREVFDTIEFYDTICSNYTSYEFYEYSLPVAPCDTLLRHLNTIFHLHLSTALSNLVTFASNTGGLGKRKEVEYCYADGIVMPECSFTKNNYHFIGWSLEQTGTPDSLYQPGDVLYRHANVTLYARWQKNTSEGVDEVEENALNLWPNPTEKEINFSLTNAEDITVNIIDAWGRVVIQRQLVGDKAKISLENLPAGAYTVVIYTADKVYKKQVIKK